MRSRACVCMRACACMRVHVRTYAGSVVEQVEGRDQRDGVPAAERAPAAERGHAVLPRHNRRHRPPELRKGEGQVVAAAASARGCVLLQRLAAPSAATHVRMHVPRRMRMHMEKESGRKWHANKIIENRQSKWP